MFQPSPFKANLERKFIHLCGGYLPERQLLYRIAARFQEKNVVPKTFYLTTPIYYPNEVPHIGTAYTTIAADILVRWHRLKEGRAFLLTGTDEHGQKVEQAAQAKNIPVQTYVDRIAQSFKDAWKRLGIQYDEFIRTTELRHIQTVIRVFENLKAQGNIFKSNYEGWYCVSCETFWLENQLIDKHCPNAECGKAVEWVKEEDWFFKLSAFQEKLLKHYQANPDFVRPETRFNEVVSFVKSGLQDVCVSRKGLGWGIGVPGDSERSIYVWIDALINYVSALDYHENSKRFQELWPADLHLVGKDILRFHAVIWPAMLMALKLPLPKAIFANGWLTMEGSKISKSRGGHRNLFELLDLYGPDPIRYFLMREASFGSDLDFSEEGIIRRLNTDLANDLGNLAQRSLSMVHRYREGKIPEAGKPGESEKNLRSSFEALPGLLDRHIGRLEFRDALSAIFDRVVLANRYVDESAPWKLDKAGNQERLSTVLHHLVEALRILSIALSPFMPESSEALWKQLGFPHTLQRQRVENLRWGGLASGSTIGTPSPLFKKVETKYDRP